jgi:hypothetical protein
VIRQQRAGSLKEDGLYDGIGVISIPLHDYIASPGPESVRLHFSQAGEQEKKGVALVEISSTIISEVANRTSLPPPSPRLSLPLVMSI